MRVIGPMLGALLIFGTSSVSSVFGAPQTDEQVADAANEIHAAWSTKDDAFDALVRRGLPDRFQVILAVALNARDTESRKQVLEAMAASLRRDDAHAGAATEADYWAQASEARLKVERNRLRALQSYKHRLNQGAVDARFGDGLSDEDASSVPRSVVQPLAVLFKLRALTKADRTDAALREAQQLAITVRIRRWHYLGVRLEQARAEALRAAKRPSEAVDAYRRMADHAALLKSSEHESLALQFAIVLLTHQGRMAQRYALGLRLHELALRSAPKSAQLASELWLTDCEHRLGEFGKGVARAKRVMDAAKKIDVPDVYRRARTQLLSLRRSQGQFGEALKIADEIRSEPAFADPSTRDVRDVMAIAQLFRDVGQESEALRLCQTALTHASSARQRARTSSAMLLGLTASLLNQVGKQDESRELHERTAKVYRSLNQPHRLMESLTALVQFDLDKGDIDAARNRADEVRRLSERLSRGKQASALELVGRVQFAAGQFEACALTLRSALQLTKSDESQPAIDAYRLALLGKAHDRLGHDATALKLHRGATETLVRIATGIGERHALALRTRAHDVAMAGVTCAQRLQRPGDLWWFREAGHSLLLADFIENRDDHSQANLPPQARADEETALRRLSSAQTRLLSGIVGDERQREAQETFRDARKHYESIVQRSDRLLREQRGWRRAKPVALDVFQRYLAPQQAALAYVLAGDRILGSCITNLRVATHDLGHAKEVTRLVSAWRDLASAPGGPTNTLGAILYDRLMRPFEKALNACSSILVLPAGALANLPFSGLVCERKHKNTGVTYVLDRWRVSYVPSGTVYVALSTARSERKMGTGLLAVGDPDYSESGAHWVESLGGTQAEIRAIASLYPKDQQLVLAGTDATVANWEQARSSDKAWRAVHVACHGLVDTERPWLSGLVFSGGHVLSIEQVCRRRLLSDVVVLSACETAYGTSRRGEGVMAMTRAFFQAGVPSVVASTWAVSDAATGGLMATFHRSWQQPLAQASSALRNARLSLRRQHGHYAHPYFWAPFVLWGR